MVSVAGGIAGSWVRVEGAAVGAKSFCIGVWVGKLVNIWTTRVDKSESLIVWFVAPGILHPIRIKAVKIKAGIFFIFCPVTA